MEAVDVIHFFYFLYIMLVGIGVLVLVGNARKLLYTYKVGRRIFAFYNLVRASRTIIFKRRDALYL